MFNSGRRQVLAVLVSGAFLMAPAVRAQGRVSIGPGITVQAYDVGLTFGGALEVSGTLATRGTTLRFTAPDASGGLVLGDGLRVELSSPQTFTPTVVNGPAQLRGVLRLDVPTGVAIPAGASFTVLTCTGGCTGKFDRVEAPFNASVTYGTSEVTVRALTSSATAPVQARSGAALHAPAPHPFTDRATLRLDLPASAHVRADVYDLLGRNVAVLHDGPLAAGTHALVWDAHGHGAGTYVVRLRLDGMDSGLSRTLFRR
jgi:hypothetical protein